MKREVRYSSEVARTANLTSNDKLRVYSVKITAGRNALLHLKYMRNVALILTAITIVFIAEMLFARNLASYSNRLGTQRLALEQQVAEARPLLRLLHRYGASIGSDHHSDYLLIKRQAHIYRSHCGSILCIRFYRQDRGR